MEKSHPYYTKAQLKNVLGTRLRSAINAAKHPKPELKPIEPKLIAAARKKVLAYDKKIYLAEKIRSDKRRDKAEPLNLIAQKMMLTACEPAEVLKIIEKIEALSVSKGRR